MSAEVRPQQQPPAPQQQHSPTDQNQNTNTNGNTTINKTPVAAGQVPPSGTAKQQQQQPQQHEQQRLTHEQVSSYHPVSKSTNWTCKTVVNSICLGMYLVI